MSMKDEEAIFKTLKGKFKHFCYDWDFMAIDETFPEWDACTCFDQEVYDQVKEMKNGRDLVNQ